ncbi:MAG: hypothetical protein JWN70_4756 [Planctomycetaceae bacterium]|nr:hypothetical protein [Planctomycetaceae bacterium]
MMLHKLALTALPGSKPPRLLVSVRNVEEAAAAIRGGCDILDVKEPNRGSLGMASPMVWQQITEFVHSHAPHIVVTAALGEVYEYQLADALGELPATVPAMDLVKLGTAELGATAAWQQTLRETRAAISHKLTPKTEWVAVAYADWEAAEAPSPSEVIAEALGAGCRGVLFDTYEKDGRGLLDWITTETLQLAAQQLHERGLFLALAGSLKLDDLAELKTVPADIIAIRGAACAGGLRTDSIHEQAVREFRTALESLSTT